MPYFQNKLILLSALINVLTSYLGGVSGHFYFEPPVTKRRGNYCACRLV